MLRRVAFVRTDVSEERSASIIGVIRFGELNDYFHPDDGSATFLQMSVLKRTTRRNIPEDDILRLMCCCLTWVSPKAKK
jgi:hypothetical protein